MNKKQAIIQAVIDAFTENGINKTTISDIVKRAGIAQGTFYLYFKSKWTLMPAIAEVMVVKTLDEINDSVENEAPFPMQLEQFIDAIFKVNKEYSDLLALIYSGLAATEHLKEWETVYAPIYDWVSDKLTEAQGADIIRKTLQPERTAKLLIGLIESAAEQVYLYDHSQDDEAAIQKEELRHFVFHALDVKSV